LNFLPSSGMLSQSPSERGSGSTNPQPGKVFMEWRLNPLLNGALVQPLCVHARETDGSQSPSERGSGSTDSSLNSVAYRLSQSPSERGSGSTK